MSPVKTLMKDRHMHVWGIDVHSYPEPLECGSQYFVTINEKHTYGMDREELIQFRDSLNEGITKALAYHAPPVSNTSRVCIHCSREVTAENGFATVIGSMHFDCEKEKEG